MRQEVVFGDSGYIAVTRFPSDTVAITAIRGLVQIVARVDSTTAARFADQWDSTVRLGLEDGTVTVTRIGADTMAAVRLDATNAGHAVSIVFDAGAAGTVRRVLRWPLVGQQGVPITAESGLLYLMFQVEQPVRPLGSHGFPSSFDVVRDLQRPGHVLAQFVVDTAGRPRVDTFSALQSSDPALAAAVLAAVAHERFMPGTIGGRPVNQIVRESFAFVPPRGP
jgi:hypothetical protein